MSQHKKHIGAFSFIADFDGDIESLYNSPYPEILPILPLRGLMPFPGIVYPITIGRESSLKLILDAQKKDSVFACAAQKDAEIETPSLKDLYKVGVATRIIKIIDMPNDLKTVIVQSLGRVKIKQLTRTTPYMRAHVERLEEILPKKDDKEYTLLVETCMETANIIISNNEEFPEEATKVYSNIKNNIYLPNFIASSMEFDIAEKYEMLKEGNQKERCIKILKALNNRLSLDRLKMKIQMRTQNSMDKQQKDYFLQQQIKSIQDELGESNNPDIEEIKKKAEGLILPEKVQEAFKNEIEKVSHLPQNTPDYSITLNYLKTLVSLPWGKTTADNLSITHAERVLNRDHYGMEKVKERILEYLAELSFRQNMKAPILCLVGPPGVGKTSLGHSIADSIGRKYIRISLGGVHDEAEIRGHRRTYVGAMPGRIIKGLQKAETDNPVFILDEIDKVSSNNFNGDPQSALLEVLDPAQNNAFHDNFLDLNYDLSKILFIATANSLQTIPAPLLDRMEIIRLDGYLTEEKKEIAKRHLIPRLNKDLTFDKPLKITPAAVEDIIENYTRESGVRQLEKQLEKIFRKTAYELVKANKKTPDNVGVNGVKSLLGNPIFTRDKYQGNHYAGVVTGLAWTSVGGEILFIETSISEAHTPKLTLTGNLGDVMKESAILALEYIKAQSDILNLDKDFFDKHSVHIHVPEGATPKDGPSAGITIATSIASAVTHRKVKKRLAMTGEITLRGKVLPVGGIKEKILAAKRAGITDIVMSKENERDIEEIKECYIKGLTFHFVEHASEVLQFALLEETTD